MSAPADTGNSRKSQTPFPLPYKNRAKRRRVGWFFGREVLKTEKREERRDRAKEKKDRSESCVGLVQKRIMEKWKETHEMVKADIQQLKEQMSQVLEALKELKNSSAKKPSAIPHQRVQNTSSTHRPNHYPSSFFVTSSSLHTLPRPSSSTKTPDAHLILPHSTRNKTNTTHHSIIFKPLSSTLPPFFQHTPITTALQPPSILHHSQNYHTLYNPTTEMLVRAEDVVGRRIAPLCLSSPSLSSLLPLRPTRVSSSSRSAATRKLPGLFRHPHNSSGELRPLPLRHHYVVPGSGGELLLTRRYTPRSVCIVGYTETVAGEGRRARQRWRYGATSDQKTVGRREGEEPKRSAGSTGSALGGFCYVSGSADHEQRFGRRKKKGEISCVAGDDTCDDRRSRHWLWPEKVMQRLVGSVLERSNRRLKKHPFVVFSL